MPKVTFKYNIKKDAWSWVLIAKNKNHNSFGLNWREQVVHIPDELLTKILKLDFPKAQDVTEKYLKIHAKREYREVVIKENLSAIRNVWGKTERRFFNTLSNITQLPIYTKKFGCFLTTGFMCPYSQKENWFMISMWHSLPFSITTICHELLHLQFLHYYKNYLKKKGLGNQQIEDLKEALTFLLNEEEFKEIILVEDRGYPSHQKLRSRLKKIWQDDKIFNSFLEKAIKVLKTIKY